MKDFLYRHFNVPYDLRLTTTAIYLAFASLLFGLAVWAALSKNLILVLVFCFVIQPFLLVMHLSLAEVLYNAHRAKQQRILNTLID